MAFLLDVNVLIALFDPVHVHHDAAHEWFDRAGKASWATCPLTENGVLRIIGNPRYPNSPGTPATVMTLLSGLVSLPGHVFWPDDISLVGSKLIDPTRLLSSNQVTDTYLLALARTHGGQLATFDRRLVADAVQGGKGSLHFIDL
ncbi:TA system VapC family ribonuclease toxin [Phyllobacterium sp. SB3]|uniref:TA system VapC family ribonuclease toxin n=1 Tax=Phyllobacterium sp. SB3 TaxID=3156073 RepID=UPI0032AF9B61